MNDVPENIYRHRRQAKQVLDKFLGTTQADLDNIINKLEQLVWLLEGVVEEKVHQFLKENPTVSSDKVEVGIESVWVSLWEGGPMRYVPVITVKPLSPELITGDQQPDA